MTMRNPFKSAPPVLPDDFESRRQQMVNIQLENRDISDARVLEIMRTIPREKFLPTELRDNAYEDRALGVSMGQTISQPYIVAFMTQALRLQPHHRVLEIGTGTGYQTAVLASLAKEVFSVERFPEMSEAASAVLDGLGYTNVKLHVGDGSLGWPEYAPFDRIIVTAAAPTVPPTLMDQLAEGGLMLIPVGEEESQRILSIEKRQGVIVERPLIPVRFVKLVGEEGFDPAD